MKLNEWLSLLGVIAFLGLFFFYGVLQARRRRTVSILIAAIVLGVPLGFVADQSPHDGPNCSFLGLPLTLMFVGYLGKGLGRLIWARPAGDDAFRCLKCDYDLL